MTDFDELKQTKAQCLSDIREALPLYANRLNGCDERLMTYIEDAISNNASHANLYELLGAAKFLRMLNSYNFNTRKVQTVIRLREGEWVPVA